MNTEKLKNLFPASAQQEDPFDVFNKAKDEPSANSGDWNTSENWDTWESSETTQSTSAKKSESQLSRQEASRLAREEKRKQRLVERQQARPKKLGGQKIS